MLSRAEVKLKVKEVLFMRRSNDGNYTTHFKEQEPLITKDYSNLEYKLMAQFFERNHRLRKQKVFSKKKRKARHRKQMLMKNKRKVHKATGSFNKSVYR